LYYHLRYKDHVVLSLVTPLSTDQLISCLKRRKLSDTNHYYEDQSTAVTFTNIYHHSQNHHRRSIMATAKEESPLLKPIIPQTDVYRDNIEDGVTNVPTVRDAQHLYRNFIIMAISFSINHGMM
jgi:hypothetical protein